MITYKTCTPEEAPDHICDPCNPSEGGRVRSLFLIKTSYTLTVPLVEATFTAAIEAGNIIVIPETSGTFDGGTPKTVPGYGDEKENKIGDDYVLNAKDPAYASNSLFWQNVEKEKWHLGWRTQTQVHLVQDSAVKITTKAPVEEDIDSSVVWNIEGKWFSANKPVITPAAPIANLLRCFEVTEGA